MERNLTNKIITHTNFVMKRTSTPNSFLFTPGTTKNSKRAKE